MSNILSLSASTAFATVSQKVQSFFGNTPVVQKTTAVAQAPMASNTTVAVQTQKATPVANKTRFERLKEVAHKNPGTTIAMLAAAIFAAVYGVDKYLQSRQLKNLENHLGSAGDLDQFPGASAILQADFEADDRFMDAAAIRGQQWKEMKHEYRNSLENVDEAFPGAAKLAKQVALADQVELLKLAQENPDLALAIAANLPDAADAAAAKIPADFPVPPSAVEPKKPGMIATWLAEQAAIKAEAAFPKDDRFISSTRMQGRGDVYGENT